MTVISEGLLLNSKCVVPENILPPPPPPPRKGSDFPGRMEVNLPNFPVGRGGHHTKIFPEGSRDA